MDCLSAGKTGTGAPHVMCALPALLLSVVHWFAPVACAQGCAAAVVAHRGLSCMAVSVHPQAFVWLWLRAWCRAVGLVTVAWPVCVLTAVRGLVCVRRLCLNTVPLGSIVCVACCRCVAVPGRIATCRACVRACVCLCRRCQKADRLIPSEASVCRLPRARAGAGGTHFGSHTPPASKTCGVLGHQTPPPPPVPLAQPRERKGE